jgi:hypothetical protein
MSQLVLDAIAASTAELTRLVPVPTGPLGYGTDLSCVEDVTEDLAEVDPFSPQAIGEALLRRLTTPRGQLPDDPNYGMDLRGYCNRGVPTGELREIAGQIRSEVTKDDRVEDVSVVVTVPALNAMSVRIDVTPADPSLDPFTLTFAVTSGQLLLEAIR